MKKYNLIETSDNTYGGKGTITYKVENYDGNKENLKQFINEMNEKSSFWITWRIVNDEIGIVEEEIDPLD